jgi:hypothetical protein
MMVVDMGMREKKLVIENIKKIRVVVDIEDKFRVQGAQKIKKYCNVK